MSRLYKTIENTNRINFEEKLVELDKRGYIVLNSGMKAYYGSTGWSTLWWAILYK